MTRIGYPKTGTRTPQTKARRIAVGAKLAFMMSCFIMPG